MIRSQLLTATATDDSLYILVVHCTTIAPPHFAHNLFDEMPHRAGLSSWLVRSIVLWKNIGFQGNKTN
ncbi:hypothetical protein HanXRQr2_Chr03g0113301 [Helianthus annuus]|uniref:Uncharacterized protein n=1 Tax=Helianthus annuus TaxID=4232 RepID=A0A9K3JGF4_HELAN|nr:hypothetical protein HanXRQr2_Chr03g0113301 [Helianthus annuus]KAJ0601032.1 hypothetical protein HanIR_Chr03g0123791 [Helianthus annuus]KAJ0943869.1 hypothetical protein HanPSC8_Chr03g0109681 [Helianthus annuus]